jgi:hypothetical protein
LHHELEGNASAWSKRKQQQGSQYKGRAIDNQQRPRATETRREAKSRKRGRGDHKEHAPALRKKRKKAVQRRSYKWRSQSTRRQHLPKYVRVMYSTSPPRNGQPKPKVPRPVRWATTKGALGQLREHRRGTARMKARKGVRERKRSGWKTYATGGADKHQHARCEAT